MYMYACVVVCVHMMVVYTCVMVYMHACVLVCVYMMACVYVRVWLCVHA